MINHVFRFIFDDWQEQIAASIYSILAFAIVQEYFDGNYRIMWEHKIFYWNTMYVLITVLGVLESD